MMDRQENDMQEPVKVKKGVGKKLLGVFAFGFKGAGKALYYFSGFWLIRNIWLFTRDRLERITRFGFKGDPRLKGSRIPRHIVLAMYDMDEREARTWASQLRRNQIVMLIAAIATFVLGFLGGAGLPVSVRTASIVAALLVLFSFLVIVLRDEWRIEVLTGQRNEWMPFVEWLFSKVTGKA